MDEYCLPRIEGKYSIEYLLLCYRGWIMTSVFWGWNQVQNACFCIREVEYRLLYSGWKNGISALRAWGGMHVLVSDCACVLSASVFIKYRIPASVFRVRGEYQFLYVKYWLMNWNSFTFLLSMKTKWLYWPKKETPRRRKVVFKAIYGPMIYTRLFWATRGTRLTARCPFTGPKKVSIARAQPPPPPLPS